jgi:hypothetical protein
MKTVTLLFSLTSAAISFAQTPTYLHVPAPRGTRVQMARWAVQRADSLGYEGVVIPVGTDQIQDPLRTDWSGFSATVNDALDAGMKVHLRLLQNVPVRAYQNGVAVGPSAWVTRYNGGVSWSQPYRPPLAICPYISKLVWQRATDILYDACVARRLNPARYASEELANEPGIRGAGGAYFGDSFANAIWPAAPEGSIEPYFWKMLRTLRYSYTARGIPTFAVTLEGTHGAVGDIELASVTGFDAQRVSEGCSGWGFNRYATSASRTPYLAASWWSARANDQVSRMRKHPLIGSKLLFNTEFGMKNSSALMTGLSDDVSIADYRLAILGAQRSLGGVVASGWFLAISTNPLGSGYQLFNADGSAVGGFVGPAVS